MKKTTLLFCIALLIVCILCSCSSKYNSIQVDTSEIIETENNTESEDATDNGICNENDSVWHPSLFEKPSTQYDNQLALVAAELSEKAEDTTGEDIKKLYDEYGITNCEIYNYCGDSAFAIGHDILCVNGIDTTVLVIVARGTKTISEGLGDFFKGYPFNKTQDFLDQTVWNNVYEFEEQIWNGLNEYLQKFPELEHTYELKIFVTGHSLGGAAANMVAARFTRFKAWGGWWSDVTDKEDIYAYTFGAIKVLTTEENASDGYENIHNIYNYYDSYGPYGNQQSMHVSSLNAKFGHTELYTLQYDESGTNIWDSCNSHLMTNYKEALENEKNNYGFIQLACEKDALLTDVPIESEINDEAENITVISDFSIEGKWKSVGDNGFGQAQPGAIVVFDGTHCNFYSPSDTYALYREDEKWRLDCTDFLFANTVSFTVEIIDSDNIYVYYGSDATQLRRVN